MDLIQTICTKNDCIKRGSKLEHVKYLIVHSPGVYPAIVRATTGKNPWYNRWNKSDVSKMVHGFVDDTGIYQFAPLDLACWQVGTHEGNYNAVGFELCELETEAEFNKVWNNAVSLYADLCKKYNLSTDKIYGHYEAHNHGFASNHGDPKPYFSRFGKTMDNFREAVKKELENGKTEATVTTKEFNPWAYAKVVNVEANDLLNVRSGSGTMFKVIRQLANGNEVDVVETYSNGWAKINVSGLIGYVNASYLDIKERGGQSVDTTSASNSNTENKVEENKSDYTVGKVYTLQSNLKVRTGAGVSYRQKQRSELSADGKKNAKLGVMAILKKGTKVTVLEIVRLSGYIWVRVPSGWLCAVEGNKIYIK